MAKYERMVNGDFHTILDRLEQAVLHGSASASYEDGSDYSQGDFHCAVRVYERYSWTGGNRVSLTLTVAGCQGQYLVSAITAGGSQGLFMKLNTMGENAFLNTITEVLDSL